MSKKRKIATIALICLFILIGLMSIAYFRSNTRLDVANSHVGQLTEQIPVYLHDFTSVTSKQNEGRCDNQSPSFSLTVYVSCSANYVTTLIGKGGVSTYLIDQASLEKLMQEYNATSVYSSNDITRYADGMAKYGFWENTFTVNGSGIPGVDQTNIYDAEGMADTKIHISAFNYDTYEKFKAESDLPAVPYEDDEYLHSDSPQGKHLKHFEGKPSRHATSIVVDIKKKYDSCTALLLPCSVLIAQ